MSETSNQLNDMMEYVERVNRENGWYDKDRPFSADIALLHSEVSEAYESFRKSGSVTTFSGDIDDDYDKDSTGAELADVFIRLLDTCNRHAVDLTFEFYAKMSYNEDRSYRHGGKAE